MISTDTEGHSYLTEIVVADRRWNNEEERGDTSENSERLREVLGPLHLGDECRKQDLRHPEESDVQHGVHACNPCGTLLGEGKGLDCPSLRVITVVSVQRVVLSASKDKEEEDGDAHARC